MTAPDEDRRVAPVDGSARWSTPDVNVPAESGVDRANAARIYDFFLGGAHNFAADREQAERILARNPDMQRVCRENRSFLRRVVEWCLRQGVTQFLDLGSGVPTVGNVHEVAQRSQPEARVAYVDFEPVAVAHAQQVVGHAPYTSVTCADLTVPDDVLGAPGVRDLLDFTRPIALLSVAVLHFVGTPDLPAVMSAYRARLSPGSVQAISHGSADHDEPRIAASMRATQEGYRGSASEVVLRNRIDIHALLGALPLVEPGIVDVVDWPDNLRDLAPTGAYAAVARLP